MQDKCNQKGRLSGNYLQSPYSESILAFISFQVDLYKNFIQSDSADLKRRRNCSFYSKLPVVGYVPKYFQRRAIRAANSL